MKDLLLLEYRFFRVCFLVSLNIRKKCKNDGLMYEYINIIFLDTPFAIAFYKSIRVRFRSQLLKKRLCCRTFSFSNGVRFKLLLRAFLNIRFKSLCVQRAAFISACSF